MKISHTVRNVHKLFYKNEKTDSFKKYTRNPFSLTHQPRFLCTNLIFNMHLQFLHVIRERHNFCIFKNLML